MLYISKRMKFTAVLAILSAVYTNVSGYQTHSHISTTQSNKLNPLYLFNFLNNDKSKQSSSTTTASSDSPKVKVDADKVKIMRGQLEKISNTQKRDYEAEAIANAPRPKELADKQVLAYNYKKSNEFPNLFKGWLRKEGGGDQIGTQIIQSTKKALKKEKYIEVLFDPVPNLDEVAFGTVWNKKFRQEVVENLQVPDFTTNRGGPATLEWSNIYWANRLAEGLGIKNIYAISLSGEGTKGQYLPKLKNNMQLLTLADAKRSLDIMKTNRAGLIILLSPCQESHYQDAKMIADKLGVSVVALNSPYSYKYDVGGGKPYILSYVMKRIPKGWLYRQYPKPFEAIIEGPEYEIFQAGAFETQPTLQTVSKLSMAASTAKYGAIGNDRIFQQRL